MNALVMATETKAEASTELLDLQPRTDALRELSEIELAYVGGGTAVVVFE